MAGSSANPTIWEDNDTMCLESMGMYGKGRLVKRVSLESKGRGKRKEENEVETRHVFNFRTAAQILENEAAEIYFTPVCWL